MPAVFAIYFNPRSHERSDTVRNGELHHKAISIHAPTRGATQQPKHLAKHTNFNPRSHERSDVHCRRSCQDCQTFQSTLPREERQILTVPFRFIWEFQSTLPREERLSDFSSLFRVFIISIHAPTRGATETLDAVKADTTDFNPRSHERSDQWRCS